MEEYQAQPKYKSERMPSREDAMEEPRRERMPSPEMDELKELYRMPQWDKKQLRSCRTRCSR
jgi:hypothetical protein